MIEPLRYHIEKNPPHAIPKAIFCQRCLSNKKTRENPGLVIKYCNQCQRCNYLCRECDDYAHSFIKTKDHFRRIVVIGPAVRKKIHRRGDSRSFPKLFDIVEIKFKSKVIHNGKCVHREPVQYLTFPSGVSGNCVHVQILGAKKLPIADAHGSSDPFVCLQFGGKRIGTTRTRPRTINPRWSNETYVIPVDPDNSLKKAEDILKIEVFDRDYFNFNDFLGHVEVTREQLLRLAEASNQKPIRLKLSLREYHGRLGVSIGINGTLCYLKIMKAESLDKMDAVGLSDPFCEVFFQNKSLGRTSVVSNSLDPVWTSGNVFTMLVEDVLKEEMRLRALAKLSRGHRANASSTKATDNAFIFRIQLYDHNRFRKHGDLGTVRISVDQFRRLAPAFPKTVADIPRPKALNHWLMGGTIELGANLRKARNSIISIASSLTGGGSKHDESSRSVSDHELKGVGLEGSVVEGSAEEEDDEVNESSQSRMADEDEDLTRPAPQEPTFEIEDSVPSWRKWDDNLEDSVLDSEEEDEGHTRSRGNSSSQTEGVPLLSMEDRSTETAGSGGLPWSDPLEGGSSLLLADEGSNLQKTASVEKTPSVGETPSVDDGSGRHSEGSRHSSMSSKEIGDDRGSSSVQQESESVIRDDTSNSLIESSQTHLDSHTELSNSLYGTSGVRQGSGSTKSKAPMSLQSQSMNTQSKDEEGGEDDSDMDSTYEEGSEEGDREEESELSEEVEESQSMNEQSTLLPKSSIGISQEMTAMNEFVEEEEAVGSDPGPSALDKMRSAVMRLISRSSPTEDQSSTGSTTQQSSIVTTLQRHRKSIVTAAVGTHTWSAMKWFDVEKISAKNVFDMENTDRGQLIVRLIPSRRGHVVRGLDVGVRHMTLGETSTVKVRYDYAYGNFWMGAHIPPRSNINFSVQLVSINGRGGLFQMPWRQYLRFYRLMRRNARRGKYGCLKCMHYTLQCLRYIKKIWDDRKRKPVEEEYEEEESEVEFEEESVLSEEKSSSSEEDDDFVLNDKNRGVVLGANLMWGFQPHKRPKKNKKHKRTKEEKARDRQLKLKEREERKMAQNASWQRGSEGGAYTARSRDSNAPPSVRSRRSARSDTLDYEEEDKSIVSSSSASSRSASMNMSRVSATSRSLQSGRPVAGRPIPSGRRGSNALAAGARRRSSVSINSGSGVSY